MRSRLERLVTPRLAVPWLEWINVVYKRAAAYLHAAHSLVILVRSGLIQQPIHEIRSNTVYKLEACFVKHVRVVCNNDLH
jgi:hypothetical protein